MNYKSEIEISKCSEILFKIAEPETNAVCWDASGDPDFMQVVSHTQTLFDAMATDGKADFGKLDAAKNYLQNTFKPVIQGYVASWLPRISRTLTKKFDIVGCGELSYFLNEQPAEIVRGDGAQDPHIDPGTVGVFFSFNTYANPTACIPRAFAGSGASRHYCDADKSKAVVFPKASLYIIDLGKQVHYAADPVIPGNAWRILPVVNYTYE